MKNQTIQFLVMAITILFFASSCSKPQVISFTEFSKKGDTVIHNVVYHPVLKNRMGCNDTIIPTQFVDGRPILQKVTGWKADTLSFPVSISVKITEADMKAHTVINPKAPAADENKTSSNSNAFWNGFRKILPWLLALLIFGFILWLLSMLPWFGNRDRHVNHTHNHHHTYQQPEVKPEEDNKRVSVPEYFKLSSDKKSETEEKTELKFRSGIPMDVLLAGMKNRNESGIQVIAYNPGDGNITINVNGEKPVPPVQP